MRYIQNMTHGNNMATQAPRCQKAPQDTWTLLQLSQPRLQALPMQKSKTPQKLPPLQPQHPQKSQMNLTKEATNTLMLVMRRLKHQYVQVRWLFSWSTRM